MSVLSMLGGTHCDTHVVWKRQLVRNSVCAVVIASLKIARISSGARAGSVVVEIRTNAGYIYLKFAHNLASCGDACEVQVFAQRQPKACET